MGLLPAWGRGETPGPPEGLMAKLMERYGIPCNRDYGQLKVSCPLPDHEDRTPSCSIDLTRGLFNCKACGRSGGVYRFIEEMQGVSHNEARRIATELAGRPVLQVPEGSRPGGSLLPGWAGGAAGGSGLLPAWARARCPA